MAVYNPTPADMEVIKAVYWVLLEKKNKGNKTESENIEFWKNGIEIIKQYNQTEADNPDFSELCRQYASLLHCFIEILNSNAVNTQVLLPILNEFCQNFPQATLNYQSYQGQFISTLWYRTSAEENTKEEEIEKILAALYS